MTKDLSTLNAVAAQAVRKANAKSQLMIEAAAWVERKLGEYDADLEQAVLAALEDGHTVTNGAAAYTTSGKTPNRNAIYAIKAKYADQAEMWVGEYPFEWVPREVKSATGLRTVYDVFTSVEDFGPEKISGEYTWRYDNGDLEAVLGFGPDEAWPTSKYYQQVLERWLMNHPYPEEDDD